MGFFVALVGVISVASGIYLRGVAELAIDVTFCLALVVAESWWLAFAGPRVIKVSAGAGRADPQVRPYDLGSGSVPLII